MGAWLTENWFNILSAVGIIGSLLFTADALRSDAETRKIQNLLTLTQGHRDLLSKPIAYPELARVFDGRTDTSKKPVTLNETIYVNLIIQHLSSAFETLKSHLSIKPEGIQEDVRWLFSLPIPHAVWERAKGLQNADFVEFVEKCRRGGHGL